MKFNILVNPTLTELLRKKRECLYEWDEIKATITEGNLLVWFDDIHHVDLMNKLKIDYNSRYDIVLHMNANKVIMTQLYDITYNTFDMEKVKNDTNVKRLMKDFSVELEYK